MISKVECIVIVNKTRKNKMQKERINHKQEKNVVNNARKIEQD